jgi:small subunit ribosomal protein S8|tara:strand:+ start:203 stop:607 length:405 start_codon:yes stop_codon:yes gene_type:complete
MVNDVISDMLTRIRNASNVKHHLVQVPFTRMTLAIASVLKEENFIEDFQEFSENNKKFLLLLLKYKGRGREQEPAIKVLKRISKPGLRVYSNVKELPIVLGDFGIALISTSQGVMTNGKAAKLGVGGEILCYIW